MIGLLLLKYICGLSEEGVRERWIYDPARSFSSTASRASEAT